MSRLRWFALVSLLGLCACVRVPNPRAHDAPAADASADAQLAFDAGPRMPEAGEPYRGPECDPAPATAQIAAGGAGALPGHAGASAGVALDAGASGSGAPRAQARADAASGGPNGGSGGASAEASARHPRSGELVITEIMSNPGAVRDDAGEWFELHNPGVRALDLGGCGVDDGAATMHALPAPLLIAAGAYVVIARGADAGVAADATLSFSLGNSADTLALVCDGQDVDRVSYDAGFPLASGASMSLDPSADASTNDSASAWCLAQASFGQDRGTPGAANPSCGDAGADAGSG